MPVIGLRTLALISIGLLGSSCATPPPFEQTTRAVDKHRALTGLSPTTTAIVEVSYYQANVEYLLAGSKRAVLFDSGPGTHKIAPLIETLTDRPVTVVPSHLHFDHVGGLGEFGDIALIDAADLRARAAGNVFMPTSQEHLGWLDQDPAKSFRVSRWLQPNEVLDLGDRRVEVLLTPGHTKTSVMLYDPAMPALFTGDFLYPGGLFVESLEEYKSTLEVLIERMPKNVTIYPAHNGRGSKVTTLAYSDLTDLHKAVCGALDGTIKGRSANAFGIPSTAYPVSKRLRMNVLKWPHNANDLKANDLKKGQ